MAVTAWTSMYNAMHAEQDRRPFSAETARRVLTFARTRRAQLAGFLVVGRWQPSRIGEGVIFDLRTAAFDHVQRYLIGYCAALVHDTCRRCDLSIGGWADRGAW